jgi:PAS domain S-box-containing protein
MENEMMKILMIDDNQDNLTTLNTLILEAFPEARVLSALNGHKGLELAASEEPDIILLDIIMPGLDGYEVCRRLKADERLCDTPVVFITTDRSDKESRLKALECGAGAFLTKPIDEIELTAQILAMYKIRVANIQKRDDKLTLAALIKEKTSALEAVITELNESEEKFKYFFENSTVGKSLTQLSGEINVNVAFCKMLGYTAEELRGKKVQELTHPDDIELTELEMNELISGKKREARFNKRYIRKDGSIIWAEVLSSVRRRADGSPMYFMTSVIDITDRIKAQEALKQSEERFQLLFNQAPLGYQSLDFDGCFIEVNQQWLDTLGYTREEVIGKWFGDFLCPEYVEGFRKRFPIFKAQGFIHSEFEMLAKNGNRLFMAFEGRIGYDVDGNFLQTHCILKDITDQKKAEKALVESQEMLSETERIGNVGGWSFNIDTMAQKWTDEIYRIHEIEITPDPSVDAGINFYTKQSRPIIENAVKRAIEYGENFDLELEIITAKGNTRAVHTIGKADLKNRRIYGFFQDITERKMTEKALIESEGQYRLLTSQMQLGLALHEIICDDDGTPVDYRFIYVNESFEQVTGLRKQDILGKTVLEVLPNTEKYWIDAYGEVALTGNSLRFENYSAELGRHYSTVAYSPKKGQFAVVIDDITDRKRNEDVIESLKNKYELILSSTDEGIIGLDLQGNHTFVNTAATKMLGYESDNVK